MGFAVGVAEIDFINFEQGKVPFTVLGWPDLASNAVTGPQVKTPDLTW